MTTSSVAQKELETTLAARPSLEGGDSPALKPLWQIFDDVTTRFADRTAVTFGDQQLSYGDLQAQASQLARRLRGLGIGPDALVGVFLERTPRMIVALLGILKAGGAYLPLDPAYPRDRMVMILEDAKPTVLLTEESLIGKIPDYDQTVIFLDREAMSEASIVDGQDAAIEPGSNLDNLAYVIYTSGSTGKPKGVMVTHANVARLLGATEAWFHFNENDVWTLFHSVSFDFSVWEIWGCLLFGGRLVVVPFTVSRSPEDFYELLVREQVTVLNQTPSAFYQLMIVDQGRPANEIALRAVVFGGEALNFTALRPWFAAEFGRQPRPAKLINMYGITETTVHVTYREVTAADAAVGVSSLIGTPIPDMQVYVLDADGQPAGIGEVGEIYVGGAGVARGYLNRPELNAVRFLPDPFSDTPGARLYKSGDLARFLPDGELEYLGRGDDQVKIQGFRIELGEIEAAIVEHPTVREARVTAHTDAAGTKRLVAYYVAQEGSVPSLRDLSEYLGSKLPPWMMPAVYLPISAFPLTPNGKVDYAALPAPSVGSVRTGAESAGTSVEQKVAGVWKAVLGAEHVGLEDNFFDIGGTSLLLISVHSQLQKLFDKKIPIADLFAYTTVRSLSEKLDHPTRNLDSESRQSVLDQAQKQRAAFARARAMKKAAV